MNEVTYGRLGEVLRSLGFSVRNVAQSRLYQHEPTGAVIALPSFPDEQEAFPHHLDAVRITLSTYGLADPFDLAARLQRAS